jgi:ribosome maturation factor RimP
MSVNEDISNAIRPIIEAGGNYLEEIKVVSAGKRKSITVIVDSDSYLNLDQVTLITKSISEVIEGIKSLGDSPFTLEVTSPGIDRPLTLPRHWKKNVGKLVEITLNSGDALSGRIESADDVGAVLDTGSTKFSDVKKAQLKIEFKK